MDHGPGRRDGLMVPAPATRPLKAGKTSAWRRGWLPILLWIAFGAGLLIQAFGPRLEISNHAFVIPPSLTAAGSGIRPAEIIAHERSTQLISGVLTLLGALGVALCHHDVLLRGCLQRFPRAPRAAAFLPLKGIPSRAGNRKQQKKPHETA